MDEDLHLHNLDRKPLPRQTPSSFRIWAIIGFVILGATIGRFWLGPHIGLTPTDPRGESIGAGLGGFVALAASILLLRWLR